MFTIVLSHGGLSMHHHFKLHFWAIPSSLLEPPRHFPLLTHISATSSPPDHCTDHHLPPTLPLCLCYHGRAMTTTKMTASCFLLASSRSLHGASSRIQSSAMEDSSLHATSSNHGDRAFVPPPISFCAASYPVVRTPWPPTADWVKRWG